MSRRWLAATIASMGWLELLALMKRVLPLLSSVAPMLESYVGARGATRGDTEALDRLSGDLKAQLEIAAQNQVDLKDTLDAQSERLQRVADELQRMRLDSAAIAVQMEQLERQISFNRRLVRIACLVMMTLLLVCVSLLAALLLRH